MRFIMSTIRKDQVNRIVKFVKRIGKDDLSRIIVILQELERSDFTLEAIEKSVEQLQINAQKFIKSSVKLVEDLKDLVVDIAGDYKIALKT